MILLFILLNMILLSITFCLGRIYEVFTIERESYHENYLVYQKELFSRCLEKNRAKEVNLVPFFTNNLYKKIVIYGLGYYYKEFLFDISLSEFEMVYYADSNVELVCEEGMDKVYRKEELIDLDFDVIVVTSISHFGEIKEELLHMGITKEIVAYSDLVYNASKEM